MSDHMTLRPNNYQTVVSTASLVTVATAAALGRVLEGREFMESVLVLGVPALVGQYVGNMYGRALDGSSKIWGAESSDTGAIVKTGVIAGAVGVGILIALRQIPMELDRETLKYAALLGGSALVGDYYRAIDARL